jgi:hypothetical protein
MTTSMMSRLKGSKIRRHKASTVSVVGSADANISVATVGFVGGTMVRIGSGAAGVGDTDSIGVKVVGGRMTFAGATCVNWTRTVGSGSLGAGI